MEAQCHVTIRPYENGLFHPDMKYGNAPCRRNAQCWWVQSVYVHPEHRRRGYYRKLYQHVRKLAKDSGASGIRLYADTANTRAHGTVRLEP